MRKSIPFPPNDPWWQCIECFEPSRLELVALTLFAISMVTLIVADYLGFITR